MYVHNAWQLQYHKGNIDLHMTKLLSNLVSQSTYYPKPRVVVQMKKY